MMGWNICWCSNEWHGQWSHHVGVDIVISLEGWALPLCSKAPGYFKKENFRLTPKEAAGWDEKRGEAFPLEQTRQYIFIFIFLLLHLNNVVEWVLGVGFCICVYHPDINKGVILMLQHMVYLEITSWSLLLFICKIYSDVVPTVSPWNYAPPPSSTVCRPCLPEPQLLGMAFTPSPRSCGVFPQPHPVKYPC